MTSETKLNEYKKKVQAISFTYKDGHDAYKWLHEQAGEGKRETLSSYVVNLLLEDKKMKKTEGK